MCFLSEYQCPEKQQHNINEKRTMLNQHKLQQMGLKEKIKSKI